MTVATRDLLTENSMCWRAGFIGQAYSSATAIPLRVTSQASVWVFARTSPTVDQESSAALHFSVSMARDRKSLSSVTYSRTGPIPRGMPLVGKISSIRVSAKAKYSGHFHESRSIRSRIASEGSTMTSSLAELSSPTCGSLGSSGPLCVFAHASVPDATPMPFVLPDSAPMRRLGSTVGRGGTSSSPAISPPLSRYARSAVSMCTEQTTRTGRSGAAGPGRASSIPHRRDNGRAHRAQANQRWSAETTVHAQWPRRSTVVSVGVAAWTRRGLDQALVLGDADGAGPGVDAELGEDIDEVTLHGRLGDEQLLGDLGVRGAGGQELDDFALAPSQLRPRIAHGGDGLRRDLRRQVGAALLRLLDRDRDLAGVDVLEQVAGGTGVESRDDLRVEVEGREDEHRRRVRPRPQPLGHLDAVDPLPQSQVAEDDIGIELV